MLGALMKDSSIIEQVGELMPADFLDPKHGTIYRAILDAQAEVGITDPPTVLQHLDAHDGVVVHDLITLVDEVVHTASVAHHATTIGEAARRRRIAELGREIASRAQDGDDPADIFREAQARFELLIVPAAPPSPMTPSTVIERWRCRGPDAHVPTGIAALDEQTGGGPVFGSRWYVVGAPDAGKTLLIVQIADTFAMAGIPVGLLAIDEEPDDITTRLLQRRSWSRHDIEQRRNLDAVAKDLTSARIYLFDSAHTIDQAADALAAAADGRPSALLIDSIQAAPCALEIGTAMNRREAVMERTRAIRAAADRHRMLVIATSEMARSFYRDFRQAEHLDDMAAGMESSAIEYSARVLMSLRSIPGEPDRVELRLAKNKHGRRTDPDDHGIILNMDRGRQVLEEDSDYKPPPDGRQAAKAAKGRAQIVQDAALIARVVGERPGLSTREFRAAVRAEAGSMGVPRMDTAGDALRGALVKVPGPANNSQLHYMDGSAIPLEIRDAVPLDERSRVLAARPPGQEALS